MRGAALGLVGCVLLLAGCYAEQEADAGPELPALTGRVVDEADLLTPTQERVLTEKSAAIERDVGPQFVIVTVPSLQGFEIEDYGVQLGRTWGIGDAERNDGLILLVAPNERRVRIEVGYGLENRVTDPFAAKVLREQVLPAFREGNFSQGIFAGSDAVIARLRSRQSDREIAIEDRIIP